MFIKIILIMLLALPLYAEKEFEPFPVWYPLVAVALMLIAKVIIGNRIKKRVEKEIEEENRNQDQNQID